METECKLLLFGLSHVSATVEMRDCFGVYPARKALIETALAGCVDINGFVILSTCNRIELYASLKNTASGDVARKILIGNLKLDQATFERNGFCLCDRDAARHLIEVCSGIDSQMIGETEILGQAKQAYADAVDRGFADALLHRVFQKSFSAAKHARENSGICIGQSTLGSVAAELARRVYGEFSRCEILLTGSGRVGADVASALRIRGASNIRIASRSLEHAETLSREIGARTVPYENWKTVLTEADVAIFCTASPEYVLTKDTTAGIMKKRRGRNLLVIDLSVPKNVEPSIGDLPDVFLYSFDDLANAVNKNLEERKDEMEICKTDIDARSTALWNDIVRRGGSVGAGVHQQADNR